MFPHTWRHHWALDEDPFVQEDADKDPVLARVPLEAVHSSFDRLFGSLDAPGPGVVFGEKGSGKSSLRLAMRRRLEGAQPARAFFVEYIEFDGFLGEARKADRLPPSGPKTARRVVDRFGLSDHVDSMLSLGVTKLVDQVTAGSMDARKLTRKHKAGLLALSGLYYRSDERAGDEVDRSLRKSLRFASGRPLARRVLLLLGTLLGAAIALVPILNAEGVDLPFDVGEDSPWYKGGAAVILATWATYIASLVVRRRRAFTGTKSVRVVPRDPEPLVQLLDRVSPSVARDLALPDGSAVESRLVLLQRFVAILRELGFESFYVLMDRVDEATLLSGRSELMRPFVESMLEHRLLQFEGLALKLFLPIELSRLYLGASPDELKSMRLDKANSIPELRWTGQELAQVAAQRLRAVRPESTPADQPGGQLSDYFESEVEDAEIREALGALGTPRLAFGFLGALFAEHARELDDDLPADSGEWRISSRRFEILKASWVDRARGLRRALN